MGRSYTRWDAAQRRRKLRERAVAYLGGRCQNATCGYAGSVAAFDFHHPDPYEKDFTISERMSSWKKIEPELAKCILLCCRCHREVHDGLLPRFLVNHDALRGMLDGDDPDFEAPPLREEDAPELFEDSSYIEGQGVLGDFEGDGSQKFHAPNVGEVSPMRQLLEIKNRT